MNPHNQPDDTAKPTSSPKELLEFCALFENRLNEIYKKQHELSAGFAKLEEYCSLLQRRLDASDERSSEMISRKESERLQWEVQAMRREHRALTAHLEALSHVLERR